MASGRFPKNPYRVNLTSGEVSQTFATPQKAQQWIAAVKRMGRDPLVNHYFIEFWDSVGGWLPLEVKKTRGERRARHHAKKSSAQLQHEIDETLGAQPLTPAERRTLGNILASGGTGAVTQGRNWPGTIRKSVVAQLERRGLVESVLQGPSRRVYYATAAGARAFGPNIAKIS